MVAMYSPDPVVRPTLSPFCWDGDEISTQQKRLRVSLTSGIYDKIRETHFRMQKPAGTTSYQNIDNALSH